MKLTQFKNTTNTSMASARTSAALIGNVTPHRVRNERFIPERTVGMAVQEGNTKVRVAEQIAGTVLGVMDGIATRRQALAVKVEEAEFRSQASRAVNQYQRDAANIRRGQMQQPITETSKDGKRTILSDGFADQYDQGSSSAAELIYESGLTNERAKVLFEAERFKIDYKHSEDIFNFNSDAKIETAKQDSLELLEDAPTKGMIKSTINDMVETGLILPSDAPALEREHVQSLNTRNTIGRLAVLNESSDDAEMEDGEFYSRTEQIYNDATEQYINNEISSAQYKVIESKVKSVDDSRSVMVEQQREYNTFLFLQGMAVQSVQTGRDATTTAALTIQDPAAIARMVKTMGVENTMGIIKTMNAMVKGGDPDHRVEQGALTLINQYRQTGLSEHYNEANAFLNDNAGSLGSHTMRTALTTARNNGQAKRYKSLKSLIQGTVSSRLPRTDRNGNETGLAIQEENRWLARATLLLDAEDKPNADGTMPEPVDLNAWFLDEILQGTNIPSYGGDGLKSFDMIKAHKYVHDFTELNVNGAATDTFPTSSGEYLRLQAWAAKEKQNIDVVMQFKGLLKVDSIVDILSQETRDHLSIKTVTDKDGNRGYE